MACGFVGDVGGWSPERICEGGVYGMESGVGLSGALWSIDVAIVGTRGPVTTSRQRSDGGDEGFRSAGERGT
jgi:hypothetical protein